MLTSKILFNPNWSLGFIPEWYLFREDCRRNQRSRSGLRRDGFVGKIPKEMPLWYEKEVVVDNLCLYRPNDRFGFKTDAMFYDCSGVVWPQVNLELAERHS